MKLGLFKNIFGVGLVYRCVHQGHSCTTSTSISPNFFSYFPISCEPVKLWLTQYRHDAGFYDQVIIIGGSNNLKTTSVFNLHICTPICAF